MSGNKKGKWVTGTVKRRVFIPDEETPAPETEIPKTILIDSLSLQNYRVLSEEPGEIADELFSLVGSLIKLPLLLFGVNSFGKDSSNIRCWPPDDPRLSDSAHPSIRAERLDRVLHHAFCVNEEKLIDDVVNREKAFIWVLKEMYGNDWDKTNGQRDDKLADKRLAEVCRAMHRKLGPCLDEKEWAKSDANVAYHMRVAYGVDYSGQR